MDKIETRYITVSDWYKYHDYPSAGSLRNFIHNKNINGFDKVIVKIGRRILIDEKAFFDWVKSHRE